MPINIPETDRKRIVIVGAGFAGFNLARKLTNSKYQVVLIDKNNYHQFQPLFYQVAMAGLEPSSICFPLRKAFQSCDNVHVRVTEVVEIVPEKKRIITKLGYTNYDILVLATGAKTNFFGNEDLEKNAFGLKSVSESLTLRNSLLSDLENAVSERDYNQRQGLLDVVIVGGGPTGVELAGALAEMKKYILPKDYKEINAEEMDIYLIQSGDHLLKGMSKESSEAAYKFLDKLGVHIMLNTRVTAYDGIHVMTKDGREIRADKVLWAAGVKCPRFKGLSEDLYTYGDRLKVNDQLQLLGFEDIYALGDMVYLEEEDYPMGHPQVAQVAIQQSNVLAKNLLKDRTDKFSYKNKGSMATVGRNRAVVDLPRFKFQGFLAWIVWLFVHVAALIGVKNKIFVIINWFWSYLTYDQSLRLIIKASEKERNNHNLNSEE